MAWLAEAEADYWDDEDQEFASDGEGF